MWGWSGHRTKYNTTRMPYRISFCQRCEIRYVRCNVYIIYFGCDVWSETGDSQYVESQWTNSHTEIAKSRSSSLIYPSTCTWQNWMKSKWKNSFRKIIESTCTKSTSIAEKIGQKNKYHISWSHTTALSTISETVLLKQWVFSLYITNGVIGWGGNRRYLH